MSRALRAVAAAALAAASCTSGADPGSAPGHPERCHLWLRGGRVVDGTGAPARRADVLVDGGRVVWVGAVDEERVEAARVVDAGGAVVAPGFIDPHAHGDPLRTPDFRNFTAMGVTTICLGQDGRSPTPDDLAAWADAVDARGPAVNVAAFVGHGTVRERAGVAMGVPASAAERARMAALVREGLGTAWGLTTGLEYEPGRFADAAELAAVAAPVGEEGAVVMSHLRSEDDDSIEASIRELLRQCEAAGCAAHVSHLKVVLGHGRGRAEEVLALLDDARARGMQVTADVYPYLASYTGIGIVFPGWARPPHDYAEVVAARRAELEAWLRRRVRERNGPEATSFGSGAWAGKTLAQVAAETGKPFEDVLIDDVGPGGASAAFFVMDREVVERLLLDPHVMVSSDGSPTMRHPRGHGAFARVIRELVVERGLLSLEEAVRKMTSLPADTIGLYDRGRVRAGDAADLVVFVPGEVRDRATFTQPYARAEGFRFVAVNGVPVRENGASTERRPGRVLRPEP